MQLTNERVPFTELTTIWLTQPTEAGDTLSGGEDVKKLVHLKLINKSVDGRYVVTSLGASLINSVLERINKEGVFIGHVVEVGGLK